MAWLDRTGRKALATLAGFCFAMALGAAPASAGAGGYVETDLASDISGRAQQTDATLVNPWGLVRGASTPWWTADNGVGLSTLLRADGSRFPASFNPVHVPLTGCTGGGTPTGIVFDGTGSFHFVDCHGAAHAARFMFATEDGSIAA